MNRKYELLDALTRSFDGDAWHGPALKEVLADVSAEEASWRPAQHVHSIWELTLHAAGWAHEVTARLKGRAPQEPDDGDWPACGSPDNDDWEDALNKVFAARDALVAAVEAMSEKDLDALVGTAQDAGFSRYGMVLGAIQHNSYHAGQIAILKKQLRAVV